MHKGFDRTALLARKYRPAIAAWDWERIKADVQNNAAEILADKDQTDHARHYDCGDIHPVAFLGTVFALMPSGKFYMPWTSNQTRSDVSRDEAYSTALEEVAEEHGLYITGGEGDPCDMFAGMCVTLPHDLPLSLCETVDDVSAFFAGMVEILGMGFHIDTRADDYVNPEGERVFADPVAARVDLVMESACETCQQEGVDVYALGISSLPPLPVPTAQPVDG